MRMLNSIINIIDIYYIMVKLLWISNIGYDCSYDTVTKLFIPALAKSENLGDIEIYVMCTGIGHRNINLDKLSNDLSLSKDKIITLKSLDKTNYTNSDCTKNLIKSKSLLVFLLQF